VLDKLRGAERDPAKVKLAFRLSETDKLALIPACVEEQSLTVRNRGAVEDLWDKGPTFDLPGEVRAGSTTVLPKSGQVSWLLLAAVGLLGLEWLTRKLLRLA
jgi:hypothetical protein